MSAKMAVAVGCGDRSVEFLIARSTDPYTSDAEREEHLRALLAQIDAHVDASERVFRLLAHKLLSPDCDEALNTLKVLDELARRGGRKVAVEIGKFKFLNNFIRILSPKHQGAQTAPEVRARAIELLFAWKKSLRQFEKIGEVYALLRRQGAIDADPQVADEIPSISLDANDGSAARFATFEDAEKARLLAELLRSKRADDLHAANRLIKSMVRAEDQKVAKFHKRKEVLSAAAGRADLLWSMLESRRNERAIFDDGDNVRGVDATNGAVSEREFVTMKELFDALLAFRPMLFRYANEAAESEDDCLAQILALNDHVNRVTDAFHSQFAQELKRFSQNSAKNSSKELLRLEPPIDKRDNANDSATENENDSEELNEPSCSFDNVKREERLGAPNSDDVEILRSPAPARRAHVNGATSVNTVDLVALNAEPTVTLNTIHSSANDYLSQELIDLDLSTKSTPATVKNIIVTPRQDEFLLNDVSITVEDLEISSNMEPKVFVQENHVQAILYFATQKSFSSLSSLSLSMRNVYYMIVIISSTNPLPIFDISLSLCSKNTLVNSKLVNPADSAGTQPQVHGTQLRKEQQQPQPQQNLKAFRPGFPVETISQIFLLFPLTENVNQVDIDFLIRYTLANTVKASSGTFQLLLR